MRRFISKAVQIIKGTIIGLAIMISLLSGAFRSDQQAAGQCFDLKTSVVISIGFSSALCMMIYESQKR